MELDKAAFLKICHDASSMGKPSGGIGTYNEKKLHFILKSYFEQNSDYHEIPYKGYICDIKRDNIITEIQTSSLSGIRPKLDAYLEENKVNIVYPVEAEKLILWVDPESGDVTPPRRSPKPKNKYSLLSEMIYIADYLCMENLTVTAVMLSVDEYRLRNGWSKDGKKGSQKIERIPTCINAMSEYKSREDFYDFVPFEDGELFTQKEFSKLSGLRGRKLSAAVKVLLKVGVIVKAVDKKPYKYKKN